MSASGHKLFLGGISNDTTRESIEAHFDKYGTILDAVVMHQDGRPRGFGFVTFDSHEAASAACAEPQVLDGRSIECKEAQPKGGQDRGRGAPSGGRAPDPNANVKTEKVFIGGLPQDCEDQKIIDYFSQYGTIVDAVVMKDRSTGRSRGFGFVKFDNTDSADRVIEDYANHQIDGKWCECKKAVPQDQMAPPSNGRRDGGRSGDRGGGKGSDYGRGGGIEVASLQGGYGGGYPGGYPSSYAAYASAYGAYGGAPGAYGAYGMNPFGYPGAGGYASYAAYGAAPGGYYPSGPSQDSRDGYGSSGKGHRQSPY